ncbi:hypothetical protein JS533_003405 [Bifidobacterium amazonense]|uniref:ABC transporter permease n=1 Tax=Bifidobacterium amazonense TaxID=2809027 RepID=A0ABS9VTC1_9BIFI|nr:hypothetical protein [Bifidobacterium amazonense]MCH9275323.1 hypothetical protein [Bifidobacterium amazonense]
MFNLLRSDLYRLVHGRKFWVVTAIIVLLTAGLLTILISLGAVTGSTQLGADGTTVTTNTAAGLSASAREVDSHSALLAASGLGSPNSSVLPMLVSILAVLAIMDDWDAGFIKNLAVGRRDRTPYLAERLLLAALLAVWNAAVTISSLELTCLAMGVRFRHAESLGVYLGYCGLNVLGTIAFVLIVVALTMTARSKALGIAASVVVGTGMLGSLLTVALSIMAMHIPWLMHVVFWLPSYNTKLYTDSIGLFATTANGVALGMPAWAHALICYVGWIVLASGATLLVNSRRDVC